MIKLRPYQNAAIKAIQEKFNNGYRKQYVVMPTGSGKTVTFLKYASENHERIMIVVPSIELMRQVYESALLFWDKNQISRKGDRFNEVPNVIHICIIHSIRGDYLDFITGQYFDLVIIDEAHHSCSASYKRLIKQMVFAPKFLGFTATPDRLDGEMLSEVLETCSYKIEISEMIDKGFLCDVEGFSVKTNIDMSDIDDHNGDFSIVQLYKKLSTEKRNNLILDICKDEMKDRKVLIFCINIHHSKIIRNLINDHGISCAHIDGTMNDKERNSVLSSFRNGDVSCLCNCQLLTEGFDEPSIDGIILARPTRSRGLFLQMIGRGLRISNGKTNCKIIDIVDNHKNTISFNDIETEERFRPIERFKSLKDIREHIGCERLEQAEFYIERADFFDQRGIYEKQATASMTEYLEQEKIYYQHPISFDEASFLIWHNELKKEYHNGYYRRKTTKKRNTELSSFN